MVKKDGKPGLVFKLNAYRNGRVALANAMRLSYTQRKVYIFHNQ
jgi:hypothetical protein